jgi:hypothetical protein
MAKKALPVVRMSLNKSTPATRAVPVVHIKSAMESIGDLQQIVFDLQRRLRMVEAHLVREP